MCIRDRFNLGYLPGGDKSITTKSTSTLTALKQAISLISDTGILVVVIYPGHPEGKIESEQVEKFFRSLDSSSFDVIKYQFINKKDPPYLIAVERLQKK